MQSATPNVCNHPTPAIPQPRGVEDAAPYGRQRNVGISITVSRCANAASLRPPLGSPERGAVTALRAVTEGLVQRGCDADAYRRGGLPRPPGVGQRKTWVRPQKMVRGRCPRDQIRVEADVTVSTVGNAVASGHAERSQPVNRGRHATQGRARRWGGACNRRSRSSDERRTGDGAPYGGVGKYQRKTDVVRHPTEGASRTPPPTGCARGYVSAEP